MREMTQDVAVVQSSHGDLGEYHLKESRESGEYTKLVGVESKAGGSGEVSSFHDTRWNEDFRVLLVNGLETRRALQIG